MDGNQQNQQTPQPKQPHPLSFLQGLEWTSGGVMLGIGFFLIIFPLLNYFNILPLSKSYPNSLGWLPHRPYVKQNITNKTPTVSPTPSFLSNPLVARAKQIGYNIIWVEPSDTTGRTVFYEGREKSDYDFREVGVIYTQSTGSNSARLISYVAGILESFEKIDNSEDEYIILNNPQTKILLPKVRLIFTASNSAQTSLVIENLSYGPQNPYDFNKDPNETSLNTLSKLGKADVKKIITPGDAVILAVLSRASNGTLINEVDKNNQLTTTALFIRRFGGKAEIEKELGKKL